MGSVVNLILWISENVCNPSKTLPQTIWLKMRSFRIVSFFIILGIACLKLRVFEHLSKGTIPAKTFLFIWRGQDNPNTRPKTLPSSCKNIIRVAQVDILTFEALFRRLCLFSSVPICIYLLVITFKTSKTGFKSTVEPRSIGFKGTNNFFQL